MLQEKWQNKAHICIRQNSDWKNVLILKLLEIINLSATNGTFVKKGEIESNFLTTPTEEPKLNQWVNTTLNQLVIQFEPSRLLYLQSYF